MVPEQDKISVEMMGFDKDFYDYVVLYRKLKTYCFEKREYVKTLMTKAEIERHIKDVEAAKQATGLTDEQMRAVMQIVIGKNV